MSKEVLQITISEPRVFKSKFRRWWHRHVYWNYKIVIGKIKAAFFMTLSNIFLSLLPKHRRDEIRKEYEDFEVQIVNESGDEQMTQAIKDALETQYGVGYNEEELMDQIKKDMETLLKQ